MNTLEANLLASTECDVILGVDEAGRGALAGPVSVAATWWCGAGDASVEVLDGPRKNRVYIRDSKKMSAAMRARSFDAVRVRGRHAIAHVPRDVVDDINVLRATLQGMRACIETCLAQIRTELGRDDVRVLVLIDGTVPVPVDDANVVVQTLASGDAKSYAIGAASILAKHSRDAYMSTLHESFPVYGFDVHKGYGTKAHLDAIATHGPCPEHRMSFRPFRPSQVTAEVENFIDDV